MKMLMHGDVLKEEEGTVTAVPGVPTKSSSVGGQRSRGSSLRVRGIEKNLAYQPARDRVVLAADMPGIVGPLGGVNLGEAGICKHM
jgi:hypothetical protein